MTNNSYYITTPLYYVNGELHIGGAYTTIATDILARYHRVLGKDVFFLTGSDEHGQKILREAEARGITPKAFSDEIVSKFSELWEQLNITHDHFIRTTDKNHVEAVKKLFKRLIENGDIYLGKYEGSYCTPCETYLKPNQDTCPTCGRLPEKISETNYFFKLSKYQKPLLEHIDSHPHFILPLNRRNEIRNRVAEGLDDLSVSRSSFDWGIEVPGDENHIIYVWVDALFNYITALGAPEDKDGKLEKYWPANLHLVGKDIIWFHCVIWPAILLSLGYELPHTIFAHGWWTINGEKISKSKGNIVYPRDVISKFGKDALRFFLIREVPFGKDGDFSFQAIETRYNKELGNDLGNLILRIVSMIIKYFDGKVPELVEQDENGKELVSRLNSLPKEVDRLLVKFDLSQALETIWALVRETNRYVESSKPWVLAKSGETEKLASVLYTLAESCRFLLAVLYPFIPETAEHGIPQLGYEWNLDELNSTLKWGILKAGSQVTKGAPLFPRLDK